MWLPAPPKRVKHEAPDSVKRILKEKADESIEKTMKPIIYKALNIACLPDDPPRIGLSGYECLIICRALYELRS